MIFDSEIELIDKLRQAKLTYLPDSRLTSIVQVVRELEEAKIQGIFVETGCALGGSAILIACLKAPDRVLNVYDVFEMIPAPTNDDGDDVHLRYKVIQEGKSTGIGGDQYYGYRNDLYSLVQQNLLSFGVKQNQHAVSLIKGYLQDTLKISEPVAFAHIDVDWYQPVKTSLERIVPRLVCGGSIILDDYFDWSGCQRAVDEYFFGIVDCFHFDDSADSMKITRLKSESFMKVSQ